MKLCEMVVLFFSCFVIYSQCISKVVCCNLYHIDTLSGAVALQWLLAGYWCDGRSRANPGCLLLSLPHGTDGRSHVMFAGPHTHSQNSNA